MDRIKVNGEYLVLPANFYIPLNVESPLFIEEFTPGQWSFPFWIPNDEEGVNARALKYPHKVNTVAPLPRKYDCEFYVAGGAKVRAKIKIINANNRRYEVAVFTTVYALEESYKNKSIREIFDEVHEILPAPQVKITFEGTGGGIGYLDFIINGSHYDTIPWNTDINTTLNDIADIVNADTENNGVTMVVTGDQFDIIQNEPGPKCVIDYMGPELTESGTFGIALVNDTQWLKDYNDDLFDALMALQGLFYGDSDVCFPIIYNPGFYGYTEGGTPDKNPEFLGFLNYTNTDGDYMLNFKTGEDHDGNYYGISPQMFCALVWDRIMNDNNVVAIGDFLQHVDWKKLHFYNNRSLDCIFESQSVDETYLTFYNSFTVADFLPDMKVIEFTNQIKTKFCLAFLHDPGKNIVNVIQRKTPATTNKITDISTLSYLNAPLIRHEKAITGITFHQENDPADQAVLNTDYLDQHADYIVGDGSEPYDFMIATTSKGRVTRTGDAFFTQVYCPILDQLGSSLEFGLGINEFTPRILIYRGMTGDTNEQDYPYSTNDDTDHDGEIEGALSLLPEKLYTNHWKAWSEIIINGIPISVSLLVPPNLLLNLKFDEKYRFFESQLIIEKAQTERIINGEYLVTFDFRRRAPGKGL